MNYHIMAQDKFIDSFIEDIHAIGEEANNIFWIRGHKNENYHLKTLQTIDFIGNDSIAIKNKLNSINLTDTIIVHWYDVFVAELVLGLPNTLVVFFWGGEFYEYPFWRHAHWIYDKQTFKVVAAPTSSKISFTLNFTKFKKRLKKFLQNRWETDGLFQRRLLHAKRIDFIVCSSLNTFEIDILRNLYPTLTAKHLSAWYDLNYDLAQTIAKTISEEKITKVFLGNSANPSNNHLDAFEKLKKLNNIAIYCPLSYGEAEWYIDLVIKAGHQIFGDKFFPIIDFMTREKYVEFIADMDVIYMFHNRSQAWGNIATALSLGKPVFLKKQNPIHQFIHKIGIRTYDAMNISTHLIKSSIDAALHSKQEDINKLNSTISTSTRLQHLKALLKEVKDYEKYY